MVSQPAPAPVWKQEVNRRLAAHMSRKDSSSQEQKAPKAAGHSTNSRAALAAARVAARYANAPSFSQMQAMEARSAKRAAEASANAAAAKASASKAPVSMQPEPKQVAKKNPVTNAAASTEANASFRETPLRPKEQLRTVAPARQPEAPRPSEVSIQATQVEPQPQFQSAADERPLGIRWEPDMPVRQAAPSPMRESTQNSTGSWREPVSMGSLAIDTLAPVEPDQPIHANLIEFPRELVASRKARPRLAEGPFAEPTVGQLSIFEVDPGAISTEAAPATAAAAPAAFEWSGIQLDAHPEPEEALEVLEEPEPATPNLDLASFSRRLLAAAVDASLVSGAFLLASSAALAKMDSLPAMKPLEIGTAVALLATALVYHLLFTALAGGTPGMRYAGVSLCTFDDQTPTFAQRCGRLGALALSVVPVGLGVAWAVFDEQHLSWHDRLSKTYQRRCC